MSLGITLIFSMMTISVSHLFFGNWPWYFVSIFSMFPSSVVRKHHVFGFALDTAKLRTQ